MSAHGNACVVCGSEPKRLVALGEDFLQHIPLRDMKQRRDGMAVEVTFHCVNGSATYRRVGRDAQQKVLLWELIDEEHRAAGRVDTGGGDVKQARVKLQNEILDRFDVLTTKLATPDRWTQRGVRMADGSIDPLGNVERAVAWCVLAAIDATSPSPGNACRADPIGMRCFNLLTDETAPLSLVQWNDTPERTHADVLGLLRRTRSKLVGDPAP